jgi:5'-methylthioadenosine phosphorylase
LKLAVIGGSGLYSIPGLKEVNEVTIDTPFGATSSAISELSLGDHSFYFLPRHGRSHQLSPSEVPYCANVYALKSLGVSNVISVSAVGSLRSEMKPGDFVLPSQYIDWTKGQRRRSFFGNGVVGHVSSADPISLDLQSYIAGHCKINEISHHVNGTYICIEGPQFSTRAESKLYRSLGADIIGMTNLPEAHLCKEAGMNYAGLSMVTDYDAWTDSHCTLTEIMRVMKSNAKNAQIIIKSILASSNDLPSIKDIDYRNAVVTNQEFISEENKNWLKVILA